MHDDLDNLEVDPDAMESIMDASVPYVALAIAQYVDAGDIQGLLAFRDRFVEELIEEAAEMDIPDIRVRRIQGEQWKMKMHMQRMQMPDDEALRYIQSHFWEGGQFVSPAWTGSDES